MVRWLHYQNCARVPCVILRRLSILHTGLIRNSERSILQREQNPGHPGLELASAGMDAAVGMFGGACGGVFMLEGPDGGRLPELEQNDERQEIGRASCRERV